MSATVAHITQPIIGERVNGDAVVVRDEGARVLLAVIDGLGHGPIAAEAAKAAVATLYTIDLGQPVFDMMQTLHDRLRGTRGAAATVCVIRGHAVEACAVGNVQLSASNASVPLVLSAGVLGMRVAKFHVCQGALRTSARIVLYTDGITSRLTMDDARKLPPDAACKHLFERFRKKEDDATILIADFAGPVLP